jgi:hypothetical protein
MKVLVSFCDMKASLYHMSRYPSVIWKYRYVIWKHSHVIWKCPYVLQKYACDMKMCLSYCDMKVSFCATKYSSVILRHCLLLCFSYRVLWNLHTLLGSNSEARDRVVRGDATHSGLAVTHWRFGGTCRLDLQGWRVSQARSSSFLFLFTIGLPFCREVRSVLRRSSTPTKFMLLLNPDAAHVFHNPANLSYPEPVHSISHLTAHSSKLFCNIIFLLSGFVLFPEDHQPGVPYEFLVSAICTIVHPPPPPQSNLT